MPKVQTDSGAVYDFSDDFKDQEILDFIESQEKPGQQFDPSQIKLSPYEQARMAGPMEQMGPMGPIDPADILNLPGVTPLARGLAEGHPVQGVAGALGEIAAVPGQLAINIADIPSRIRNKMLGPTAEVDPNYVPLMQEKPRPTLPQIPWTPEEEALAKATPGLAGLPARLLPYTVGAANLALSTAEQFIQPEVGLTLPLLGGEGAIGRWLALLFGAQQLAQFPADVQDAIRVIQDPNATTAQKTEAFGRPGVAALLGGTMVRAGLRAKGPYASRVEEAAEVHGDLRAQPIPGERQMPSEEGSARVQPAAQEVAEGAQVPLSPEEQAYRTAERAALDQAVQENLQLGLPTKVVESGPVDPDAPFARQYATLGPNGEIVVNPDNLRLLLRSGPPESMQRRATALINEEAIHALGRSVDKATGERLIPDQEFEKLYNSLTGPEKWLHEMQYFGSRKARAKYRSQYSDVNMGEEYLRAEYQRLLRMDVREVIEAKGTKAAFKTQVIEMIQRLITAARRMLKTQASTNLDAMIRKLQRNVDAARGAKIGDAAPGGFAKKLQEVEHSDIDELIFSVQQHYVDPETERVIQSGWVQVDGFSKGEDMFSSNPEDMRAAGYQVPTTESLLQQLPQGQYSHHEVAGAALPAKGMVRMYHGQGGAKGAGMGSLWWTTNPRRAVSFGENVSFVDVPQAVFDQGTEAVKKTGKYTKGDAILPDEWILKAKPTVAKVAVDVFDTDIIEREGAPAAFAKKKATQGPELPLKPVAPGEARPEFAVPRPPISPAVLEQEAVRHLTESARPNFPDFSQEIKANFGDVKPGQLRDLWQDQVWGGLMKATGAELQSLARRVGLEKQLGPGSIVDAPPEVPSFRLVGEATHEGRESEALGAQQQRQGLSRRYNAIASIARKLINESEPGRKTWQRSEVSTEDLADPKIETKQPVWQAFTTADASNPAELGAALTADARAFGGARITKSVAGKPVTITQKGLPVSVTKRVTAIQNKTTGKVSLVSTYRDGRRGPVLLDPDAPKGTHSPIDSILKRYRVLNSMLLDEPVQNFRQDFKTIRDYEVNFAQDVRAESEKFAGYEPPPAPEAIVPRGTVRAEGMTADEPKSIIDQIIGEVGDPESPEDVKLAWEALPQAPEGRTIIESLRKLGSQLMAREPNLTQAQFLDRLATQIYENHSQAKTFEDFQRRTMAQGSPEAGAAAGVAAEPGPRAEAPAAGPAPGPAGVEPAAFAKAREAAEERWAMAKRSISLAMKRREVRGEIPALLDGADNASAQFAVNAGNHVRVQSKDVKVREAAVGLIAAGEIEKPGSLFEGQWFPNPKNLPRLFDNLDAGELRAKQWLLEGNPIKRHFAKKWLRAIDRMREGLRYAQDHWNDEDLQNVAMAIRKELKDTLEWENDNGSDVQERQGFYPGRYEGGFWMDSGINFGPQRILGGQFRLPKTFTDPYDAISKGPYIQASFDPADVVESRVRSGHRIVERKLWQEALKGMRDPGTGQPIAKDPVPFTVKVKDPRTGDVTDEVRYKSPSPEYELVKPFGWQKPIAVRSSYVSLVRSVTAGSRIAELPVGKEALMLASQLKHGVILIADTFHPARVGQYAAALLGLGKVGFKGGYAAISFRPEDLPDAVRQGYITQAQADWAMEPVSLKVMRRRVTPSGSITTPETIKMTRQQVATELISRGLNAARISDAIYRDAVQNIPFVGERWHKMIGPFNNWLFGRFMPGLITETAVRNLERLNNASPNVPLHRLIRDVIKDTNIFYGNMGRQGIFRNATFRDLAQIFLLAPLWQEGLIQKEIRFASRLTGLSQLTGRAGLPYLGTLGRGMANGLLTYFALSQLVNLATRRQFTWQNKEEGHKLDAWIPAGEGKGFWLSPLAVFGEVTHDLIRLGETKPTVVDALEQMGANRAGPVGKLFYTLVKGKTPMGEQYTTSKARLWGAASQVVPFAGPGPISFAGPGRAIAHALFPEHVRPPPRGTFIRQGLASLAGMKVQPSETAVQMVSRAAERFVKAQGLKKSSGWIRVQTDEASYSKLRAAIRNDDPIATRENYLALLKDHSDAEILKAMRLWARRGFTGSKKTETAFKASLDDAGWELYNQADQEKQAVKQKYEDWLVKQPVVP